MQEPAAGGSVDVCEAARRSRPPAVVRWLAVYLSACSLVALLASLLPRTGALAEARLLDSDVTLLHGLYAACWGALGACLNGSLAVAKHCAARDFEESWTWWYLAKPPMGAVTGLVVYVLSKGLGSFLGMTPDTSGLGVAAVAFMAGFATERVIRKIEEVSKTLFAVADRAPVLTIVEPVPGQRVTDKGVRVVVIAAGPADYLCVACREQAGEPVDLKRGRSGPYQGWLPLQPPHGRKTLRVTGVFGDQVLTADAEIEHAEP